MYSKMSRIFNVLNEHVGYSYSYPPLMTSHPLHYTLSMLKCTKTLNTLLSCYYYTLYEE